MNKAIIAKAKAAVIFLQLQRLCIIYVSSLPYTQVVAGKGTRFIERFHYLHIQKAFLFLALHIIPLFRVP